MTSNGVQAIGLMGGYCMARALKHAMRMLLLLACTALECSTVAAIDFNLQCLRAKSAKQQAVMNKIPETSKFHWGHGRSKPWG